MAVAAPDAHTMEIAKTFVPVLALLLSALSLFLTLRQGAKMKERETTLENRRFVVTLWDKLVSVSHIDPNKPIVPDVLNAVNTLELVAICWEAGIVDKHMLTLVFGREYGIIYKQIEQISQPLDQVGLTGPAVLADRPVVRIALREIEEQLTSQSRLPGVGGRT